MVFYFIFRVGACWHYQLLFLFYSIFCFRLFHLHVVVQIMFCQSVISRAIYQIQHLLCNLLFILAWRFEEHWNTVYLNKILNIIRLLIWLTKRTGQDVCMHQVSIHLKLIRISHLRIVLIIHDNDYFNISLYDKRDNQINNFLSCVAAFRPPLCLKFLFINLCDTP